jgi:hypothetical protein
MKNPKTTIQKEFIPKELQKLYYKAALTLLINKVKENPFQNKSEISY